MLVQRHCRCRSSIDRRVAFGEGTRAIPPFPVHRPAGAKQRNNHFYCTAVGRNYLLFDIVMTMQYVIHTQLSAIDCEVAMAINKAAAHAFNTALSPSEQSAVEPSQKFWHSRCVIHH
jgi:hypothetical protein